MSYDTDLIEKKFRDMRKITVPEGSVGRGRKANIDAIRNVLQNWGNLSKINKNIVPPTMLSKYKKYIEAFIAGDNANCPKRYLAIIEQYKSYILKEKVEVEVVSTVEENKPKDKQVHNKPEKVILSFVEQLKLLGVSEFVIKF